MTPEREREGKVATRLSPPLSLSTLLEWLLKSLIRSGVLFFLIFQRVQWWWREGRGGGSGFKRRSAGKHSGLFSQQAAARKLAYAPYARRLLRNGAVKRWRSFPVSLTDQQTGVLFPQQSDELICWNTFLFFIFTGNICLLLLEPDEKCPTHVIRTDLVCFCQVLLQPIGSKF